MRAPQFHAAALFQRGDHPLQNDADDTLYAFLLTAVHRAQARLHAATPYFVPDDALLQADQGVDFEFLRPPQTVDRVPKA